jgi:hypothetical protein
MVNSPVPLHIAITLVDEMKTIVTGPTDSAADWKKPCGRARGSRVAITGTTTFHGQRAVDGGVLTALPFRVAVQDSCTRMLSLRTHPMEHVSDRLSLLNRYTRRRLDRLRPGLGDGYLASLRVKYQDHLDPGAMRKARDFSGPAIFGIAPLSGTPDVKRQELSLEKLIKAARSAYEVMYAPLEGRQSWAVSEGLVRPIPRFGIAERADEDRRLVHLAGYRTRDKIPWGIARTRSSGPQTRLRR